MPTARQKEIKKRLRELRHELRDLERDEIEAQEVLTHELDHDTRTSWRQFLNDVQELQRRHTEEKRRLKIEYDEITEQRRRRE